MSSDYIPGVCNIGRSERKRRLLFGWAGVAISVALWGALAAIGAARAWRLLLVFPATIAALGFIQYRSRFCAAYGLGGVFSLGPKAGATESVEQAEFRRQDRRKAAVVVAGSLVIGGLVATAAWLTPV